MTSTAKKHRDLDQTPLSRSNAHGVYLKIGSFDPTFIHRTIKQESVNLNKLETRPANKFSIHGFLTHRSEVDSFFDCIRSDFSSAQSHSIKVFFVSVVVVGCCAELLVALQRKTNTRPYSQYPPSLYALKD